MRHIVFLSHLDSNLYLFRRPIMRALVAKGWQVTAVVPSGSYSHLFAADGITHVPYVLDRGSMNPYQEFRVVLTLRKLIKKLEPDLVHSFTMKPNIYGTFAARLAGVPVIINSVTGLGSFFLDGKSSGAVQKMLLLLYWLACRLNCRTIFQNRDDQEFFIENKIIAGKKTVLIKGSGVELERYNPRRFDLEHRNRLRNDLGIDSDALVVSCISRLIRDKGVGEFCEAARALHQKWKGRAVFLEVGDFYDGNPSSLPKEYVEDLARAGIVNFAGWRTDIPEILHASDIVTLPSYREGLPVSLQEALAMGKPIVSTDVPGCRETVDDGINGILVPARDAERLAQALESLLLDSGLRQRMGEASLAKARAEFDVRKIVEQHLVLYESLVSSDGV